MNVIVTGKLYVDPSERDAFIEAHLAIVKQARKHPGCLDLSISADPAEPGRVNMFEHFASEEALDAWRAVAPSPSASFDIKDAQVLKHVIARSGPPFD